MELDIQQLWDSYVLPWSIKVVIAIAIFYFGRMAAGILVKLVGKVLTKAKMDTMLVRFISSILNALLLLFVVIAALSQMGVDTTSLVALVGAAGLAVGLALQDSLKNFAAGVMLIVFKPFRADDFVEAAGVAGIVEEVGIFTSQLRTGDNKLIIIPNGKIYADNIINYSQKGTRRVDMMFGIDYSADLRKAKAILQRLVEEDSRILSEPEPLIAVAALADSCVNFHVRPWVKTGDYWNVYWDMQEKVKMAFEAENIAIPFPQMDIHLHRTPKSTDKVALVTNP